MTTTDYRKEPNLDETIITPTSLPRLNCTQTLALLVASSGHYRTIGVLDGMQFYRLCKTLCADKPVAWKILRETLVSEQCDEDTKWYIVLEMLRLNVVSVEDGMLVKKEKIGRKQVA